MCVGPYQVIKSPSIGGGRRVVSDAKPAEMSVFLIRDDRDACRRVTRADAFRELNWRRRPACRYYWR